MGALQISGSRGLVWIFRGALFATAASLAGYIVFKYATQLHAITGLYAFLFPLSSALAVAGIVLAVRPRTACDCSTGTRAGFGALAVLWLVTGVICVPSLLELTADSPASGTFATFHMVAQHIFLSFSVLAFAFAPRAMVRILGVPAPGRPASDQGDGRKLVPN